MGTVIGIVAEELIELDPALVQAHPVVELGHDKLILIGEEEPFGRLLLGWLHHKISRFVDPLSCAVRQQYQQMKYSRVASAAVPISMTTSDTSTWRRIWALQADLERLCTPTW